MTIALRGTRPAARRSRFDLSRSDLATLLDGEAAYRVEQVWQALPLTVHDPLGLARWFQLESAHLGGTPLALLQAGQLARVVDAAAYVGGS